MTEDQQIGTDLEAAPADPPAVPPGGPPTRRRRRRWLLITGIVLGVLIVILAALAGGSYWWFTEQVHTANERIDPATEEALATPPPSTLVSIPQSLGPQDPGSDSSMDILLIGHDKPRDPKVPSRSDVIMLLHVDRERDFFSLLSVPRDLYVDIPGYFTDRINVAYQVGRAPLAIKTVKAVLGVDVTRYMEVDFTAFEHMIDSIGGVHVDIDRRYNPHPLWPADGFDPGYQLLGGADALLFARYRFDQNKDFGRMARQQRVLAAVRDQATNWNLPTKLPGLINTLLAKTTTNLSANEMLKLSSWVLRLDGNRIKQSLIRGPSVPRDGKAVVVVSPETLTQAVTDFLTPPEEKTSDASHLVVASAGAHGLLAMAGAASLQSLPDGSMWRAAQRTVPFALQAPMYIPRGFDYIYKMPGGEGTYGIRVGSGTRPAVRMLYRYRNRDLYLGVTATTWTDAPIAGRGEEVESNGVVYTLVGTSGKVDHIWWTKDEVLYFISNTLMHTVDGDELLRMAQSMTPVGGGS